MNTIVTYIINFIIFSRKSTHTKYFLHSGIPFWEGRGNQGPDNYIYFSCDITERTIMISYKLGFFRHGFTRLIVFIIPHRTDIYIKIIKNDH